MNAGLFPLLVAIFGISDAIADQKLFDNPSKPVELFAHQYEIPPIQIPLYEGVTYLHKPYVSPGVGDQPVHLGDARGGIGDMEIGPYKQFFTKNPEFEKKYSFNLQSRPSRLSVIVSVYSVVDDAKYVKTCTTDVYLNKIRIATLNDFEGAGDWKVVTVQVPVNADVNQRAYKKLKSGKNVISVAEAECNGAYNDSFIVSVGYKVH